MAWNLVCRCILISPRNGSILVMVCWFFYCWCNFYLVKRVKYGDFGLFMEKIWKDWPADPDHLQKWLDFVHGLLILLILAQFWLSNTGKILDFRVFSEERMRELPERESRGIFLVRCASLSLVLGKSVGTPDAITDALLSYTSPLNRYTLCLLL